MPKGYAKMMPSDTHRNPLYPFETASSTSLKKSQTILWQGIRNALACQAPFMHSLSKRWGKALNEADKYTAGVQSTASPWSLPYGKGEVV